MRPLVCSIAAVSLLTGLTCVAATPESPPAATVDRQPLSALPIVARITVPVGPAWLATGFGSVWLSKIRSREVLRIDPETNRIVARIPVGRSPELGIGIRQGAVWIADTKDHWILQIDPASNQVVRRIPIDLAKETEGSFGVDADSVWMLTNQGGTDSGTLSRIDVASGKVVANIAVKPQSHAAIVGFESVWVTSSGDGTVTRVDPRTNAVVAQIPVHASPRFMTAGAGSIWVLCQGDGSLARIDPLTNRVVATIPMGVPGDGGDLAIGDGFVWVSAEGVPLSQVDPQTNRLTRQFAGGRLDDTLRVDFGAAWIVDEGHGQVWKVDLAKLRR